MNFIGTKMAIFHSLPAKKSLKKFGNFSTTDIFLTIVACQMNTKHSVKRVRTLKINLLKKYVVVVLIPPMGYML